MCLNPWDFPLLLATCFAKLTADRNAAVSPNDFPIWQIDSSTKESAAFSGKDSSQHSKLARLVQHKLPQLTGSGGRTGPCWSDPRAVRESSTLLPPTFITQCTSEQSLWGGPLRHMSDTGVTLSGYIVGKANWFLKVFSKNSSVSVVPCHTRLFLHSRCDAQGAPWHKMDETDMKWADNAATSFNLF